MKHSSNDFRKNKAGWSMLGENLALGITGAGAVDMWYDEIKDTNGGKVSSFKHGIGHYTQVVWKETTQVGCGEHGSLVVCQYGIAGNMNMPGYFDKNVLPPTKSE